MTLVADLLALAFVVLAALLRAGGASLGRSNRADAIHDAAEGVAGARRVAALLEHRELIPAAVGVVHSTLLVAAAIPATWALGRAGSGAVLVLGVILLGVVLVVVGDLLPRAMGRARPQRLAYRLAPLLALALAVGMRTTDLLNEEIEEAEGAEEQPDEDQEEIEMISSVLEFSETIVREVMVPRTDMITVNRHASVEELMELVSEHGFSRLPVVGEGIDDAVGMVIVKDLLPVLAAGRRPSEVGEVMRPIDFVPETKRASDLLREMQASKTHLVVVVDEYGSTAGLVTIEDLLEELVGEIVDEYDTEELLIERQGPATWLVDGRFPVEELSDEVGADLPADEWDTVGGLVLGLAGRVPREGERFEIDGVLITVLRVQGRRVAEVRVERGAHVEAPEGTP